MGDARKGIAHFAFYQLLRNIFLVGAAKYCSSVSKRIAQTFIMRTVGPLPRVVKHIRKK